VVYIHILTCADTDDVISCFFTAVFVSMQSVKIMIGRNLLLHFNLEPLKMKVDKLEESCILSKASIVGCRSIFSIDLQLINAQSLQDRHSININRHLIESGLIVD